MSTKNFKLNQGIFGNPPAKAEELRIDRFGNLYWCDKNKSSWTKGVLDDNYSALANDLVLARNINDIE